MKLDPRFRDRRGLLMERLQNGLILCRGRGAGGTNPNFSYLTGIDEPSAVLLLAPGGTRVGTGRLHPGPNYVRGRIVQQILFLPQADPMAVRWGEAGAFHTGSVSAADGGFDAVLPLGEMETVLGGALQTAGRLHLVRGFPPSLSSEVDPDSVLASRLQSSFLDLELRDGSRAVHDMRRSKDDEEVRAIERSIAVTAEALDRAVGAIRPGAREHEIEAEIARVYRLHGASHAFAPIVGSGANALKLHYQENSASLGAGALLLIDTGASLAGYKADITRTLPVDGRFTARQREVYEAVLRAQAAGIEACRPGALLGDVHARTWESLERSGLARWFLHGTGHHLGLETHDVGDVHAPLEPGAVVTIEPGVYLPDEAIGIRIEDDVLVTAAAPRVLSAAIPREADAVEAWVRGAAA